MYIYRANIASRGKNLQQAQELSFEHWLIASKLFFSSWERHRQCFGLQNMHRKVSSRRLRVIHVDFQTSIGLIYSLLCMEIGSHQSRTVQPSYTANFVQFTLSLPSGRPRRCNSKSAAIAFHKTLKASLHFAADYTTGCTTGWTKRFEYSYNKWVV